MSLSKSSYYALYGSLLVFFKEEEDDAVLDDFDEVLATAMLVEMTRGSF